MEPEFVRYLRESRPDLYEQYKAAIKWDIEWRDKRITELESPAAGPWIRVGTFEWALAMLKAGKKAYRGKWGSETVLSARGGKIWFEFTEHSHTPQLWTGYSEDIFADDWKVYRGNINPPKEAE